jgi:hypothetical protein
MTRDNLCTWITNNAISIGGYDNYNIYIKRASFLPKSSRQVDITLLHLARDLAYFFYGNSCAEIQDTVPLHLECE